MRTPRMLVLTARSVAGEPWAHTSRSVPVLKGCQRMPFGKVTKWKWKGPAYRHYLPPLANHPELGTHIHDRAVQAAAGLFDEACDDEYAGLAGDTLQFLPGAVTAPVGGLGARLSAAGSGHNIAHQLSIHPRLARAGAVTYCIAEVYGALKVAQILLTAFLRSGTYHRAEVSSPGISADVSFREKEDVDLHPCGPRGEQLQLRQGLRRRSSCPGGRRAQSDLVWCHGVEGGEWVTGQESSWDHTSPAVGGSWNLGICGYCLL
jgi:hypothetical protein